MDHVSRAGAALIGVVAVLTLQGCSDRANPADPGVPVAAQVATPPYTSVTVRGETLELWPWTTGSLNAEGPDDPVNLLLVGAGDPRALRAALMALAPRPMPPYGDFGLTCTWTDAVGDEQASAAVPIGWTGSAIQLACGGYEFRLHLRLFDIGDAILVGAHYEVQVPGTDEHRSLSYALAETLVLEDLKRTGLVDQDNVTTTQQVQPETHRTVEAFFFNSLPGELQAIMTEEGDVTADVPIPNGDGKITVVPFTAEYTGDVTGSYLEFTLQYDQAVPKPFCQAPGDWVYVSGPVQIAMTVSLASDGTLERHFRAQGRLSITPVDMSVYPPAPIGTPYSATVTQDHQAWATGTAHWVQAMLHQIMVPSRGADRGQRKAHLRVGSDVADDYARIENCGAVRAE